ncbi:MAG: hypothetical protein WD294_01245 [Phycisphaeraceae bacterium]
MLRNLAQPILLVFAALGLTGCVESASPVTQATPMEAMVKVGDQSQFTAMLQTLLDQPPGAFIVIEHPETQKFVQFAGSRTEGLLLDLPTHTLTTDETERARRLLQPRGATELQLGDDGKDQPSTFQLQFNRDAQAAAQLCRDIFQDIYQYPPDRLLRVSITID